MGNSESSDSKSTSKVVHTGPPSKDVPVPEDIAEKVGNAIKNHSAETPAFDIIRGCYSGNTPYTLESTMKGVVYTPLALACRRAHVDLIEFLLHEMKADPNPPAYDFFEIPAFQNLMYNEDKPEQCLAGAKIMVRAGANPNAQDAGGGTTYTKAIDMFRTQSPTYMRELLMVLATKDGTITDLSAITVPTSALNKSWPSDNLEGNTIEVKEGSPLHLAVALENTVAALVMLELGVDPTARTASTNNFTCLELLGRFTTPNLALKETIEAIVADPTNAQKATEIYDGLVAAK